MNNSVFHDLLLVSDIDGTLTELSKVPQELRLETLCHYRQT